MTKGRRRMSMMARKNRIFPKVLLLGSIFVWLGLFVPEVSAQTFSLPRWAPSAAINLGIGVAP